MTHAKEVVDNLETLIAGGEVDSCDIANLGELSGSVVCFARRMSVNG